MSENRDNTISVVAVNDRLRRIANVLLLNASFIDNLGLLNGKMGIAIFFYHYARYTQNKIFEDYAGELIDEIYEEINTNTPVNFENGLTGIGWGIEYLVKNKFVQADTDEALKEIDTTIYRNSLYRPFLLESGNDIFGYGLYFLERLTQHGNDDNNLNTLFKKQHLIYLTDDCERILAQKKYLDFKIEELSIDTINSFAWFLLEMERLCIFPFKVRKLFQSLSGYIEPLFQNCSDQPALRQLLILIEHIIPCIADTEVNKLYKAIINKSLSIRLPEEIPDESKVCSFIKETWQSMIYDPYNYDVDDQLNRFNRIFQIIDAEENWNNRLDNLNKNNLGLTGLAGIGLGLLKTQSSGHGAQGKIKSLQLAEKIKE